MELWTSITDQVIDDYWSPGMSWNNYELCLIIWSGYFLQVFVLDPAQARHKVTSTLLKAVWSREGLHLVGEFYQQTE